MIKYVKISMFLMAVFFVSHVSAQDLNGYFQKVDGFLTKYTKNGMVDYKSLNQNPQQLKDIYQLIGNTNLSSASENQKMAFYINAYNMIVIYQIVRYYPLKSALDQSGFFDQVKHRVAGENITLNKLEIIKLLADYKDPRIHFALSCAAKGCPKLANFAYLPEQLNQQLEDRAKLALNDSDFIRVDNQNKKAGISMIFKWYEKDFTTNGQTIVSFINKYRKTKIPATFQIYNYEYDWALNEM